MNNWGTWSKADIQELRYASSIKISPYIIAMSIKKPIGVIINKLRDLGLRRKHGFKEQDPNTGEWG